MRDLIVVAMVMILVTGFAFSIHGIAQSKRDFNLSPDARHSIVQESVNQSVTSPLKP